MAGARTSVYKFDGMVRGQHVYESAWTPVTDKTHKWILWEDNKRDKYAVNDRNLKGGGTHQERYRE